MVVLGEARGVAARQGGQQFAVTVGNLANEVWKFATSVGRRSRRDRLPFWRFLLVEIVSVGAVQLSSFSTFSSLWRT